MDTCSFLKKILPTQGLYVLAAFKQGMGAGKYPAHLNFKTIEALAQAAVQLDERGIQVFHACASFAEARWEERTKDGKTFKVNRTRHADNTAFVRSQWIDIDVGPGEKKDYPTRKEAAAAVVELCRALVLPAPMFVSSGRGLHCYWPFTEDVPVEQARRTHKGFASAIKSVGFKHDSSRTADLASILRPVGTHWRKEGEVEVRLLRDAEPVSYSEFCERIEGFIPPDVPQVFDDVWSTGPKSYPPSSALRIVQFCPAIAHVAEEKGNVAEPLWRAMLGVVKHTVEGEEIAHAWSEGHPQYDEDETQEKFDNWSAGPTTCETFAGLCDLCEGCRYSDKKSPIHLGYAEDAPPPVVEAPKVETRPVPVLLDPEQYADCMPEDIPFWPKGYAWSGKFLQRAIKDEEGQVSWIPFSFNYFYPHLRYKLEDFTWAVKVCSLNEGSRRKWQRAELPSKALADNQALANELGKYEIYSIGNKGKEHMRQFMQDFLLSMKQFNIETATYNAFGWHDGAFVIGNQRIGDKGDEPVLLGSRVPESAKIDFGQRGTAQEWAQIIDEVYNRPMAEPYQFLICAAFGAPLVKLVASDMWHGIPIALTGQSGLGKTTTCKAACSAFGDPRNFAISTNAEGATLNALIQRVALMRNLPLILDEMTGRDIKELPGMLYALSNGKPKERLKADGVLIGADLSWDTITFITGNINVTSLLSQFDRHRAEATQLRCFEITLPDDYNSKVFEGLNAKDLIEDKLLRTQYGVVGRQYLRYVTQNSEKIAEKLRKMRGAYNPTDRDQTRERFYYDLMCTALIGGAVAQKLGFLKFDMGALRKWAEGHIKSLRVSRVNNSYTPEDYLQAFFSYLHGRTVVTRFMRDSRLKCNRDKFEMIDEREVRAPIARHATEDRRFLVTIRGLTEWCKENNISLGWFKDELDKRGLIKYHPTDGVTFVDRIFRGTNIMGPNSRVMELNYDEINNMPSMPSHLTVLEGGAAKEAVK